MRRAEDREICRSANASDYIATTMALNTFNRKPSESEDLALSLSINDKRNARSEML